jgi:hypothetical protein
VLLVQPAFRLPPGIQAIITNLQDPPAARRGTDRSTVHELRIGSLAPRHALREHA